MKIINPSISSLIPLPFSDKQGQSKFGMRNTKFKFFLIPTAEQSIS